VVALVTSPSGVVSADLVFADLLLEALHRDLEGVEQRGLEQLERRLASIVGHRHPLGVGVDRARLDRDAGQRLPLRIGHEYFNRSRGGQLRERTRRGGSYGHRRQGDDSQHPLHKHSTPSKTRTRDSSPGCAMPRHAATALWLNNNARVK
jgi:hypothetical protein